MTDLIERIANGIIRQEGLPKDHHNPGALRGAPWLSNPTIIKGFWQPDSRAVGLAGLMHIVALRVAQGYSLRRLITSYAPPSDHNQTDIYIRNVSQWAQIPDVDRSLWDYLV